MPTDVAPITVKARVLGWLLAQLTRLFYVTSRKRYHNKALLDAHFASGQRFIMMAWHNRNIVGPMGYVAHAPRGRVFRPLASASRDGTLAAMTMHYLGVDCIRGSSSRGGTQALREMLRAAKAGADLGITPDGPRGPVYQVQAGVVAAARMTGLAIICTGVWTSGESGAALRTYGDALGLAFQIADDILDVEGDAATVGKATGKDADAGKATFVSLLGLDAAKARARDLVAEADAALAPYGEKAQVLRDLAHYIVTRDK